MPERSSWWSSLVAVVVLLTGCLAPAPSAGGADPQAPRPADACTALRPEVERALGVEVALVAADGTDGATARASGASCRLRAEGTTARLGSFVGVAVDLAAILEARGWRQDPALAADGPTGTRAGYRHEGLLATLAVDWAPVPPDACPSDRPIVTCDVPPERQRITATLAVAAGR